MDANVARAMVETLQPYMHQVFQELSDFPVARRQLEGYRDAIDSLGSIICKYRYQDVIGISLLHKHFDITAEEIVLREFESARKALMQPRPADEVLEDAVPYVWTYVTEGHAPGWYPLEFVEWQQPRCAGLELLRYADGMLIELGEALCARGLQYVFGIAGLYSRDKFVVADGETLLETSDEENRILTLEAVPAHVVAASDTTQTLWVFSQP